MLHTDLTGTVHPSGTGATRPSVPPQGRAPAPGPAAHGPAHARAAHDTAAA